MKLKWEGYKMANMKFVELKEELNKKLVVINGSISHLDHEIKRMQEEREKLEDARDYIKEFQDTLNIMCKESDLYE